MSENALVPVEMTWQDTMALGQVLASSKRFSEIASAEQAVVQVLAGRELGIGPISSMCGIYVIKGKVSIGANLMAQAVKRSAKYDYRVVELSADVAEIAFFEQGVEIGRSRFDKDDAMKAGTQNVDKFARNMLFARAISNGVKWYCPDVFSTAVYTPEELGIQVDGEGEIINVTPTAVEKPAEPENKDANLTSANFDEWPGGKWDHLRHLAITELGYNHDIHVKNTLKQLFNGDAGNLTYEGAWTALKEHQDSKEAAPLTAEQAQEEMAL